MKQKTLKKSACFISILLNIGCIIFGILSVLLLLGIIGIVFTQLFSPEMFREAWATAVQAGQSLSFGQCVFFFFCCLGEFICIFLALYNAKRIFGCIGKGNSPFTAKTAIQIRKIAMYVPYSLFLKWHFHLSLCVGYSPSSCFVFPLFLIMDVNYSKK